MSGFVVYVCLDDPRGRRAGLASAAIALVVGGLISLGAYCYAAFVVRGRDFTDADRDDLLEAIDVDSARLQRLVGDLLDLSRLEAGSVPVVREVWSVRAVTRAARPGRCSTRRRTASWCCDPGTADTRRDRA